MLKYVIIFTVGAASGIGASYLYLNKKLSEKYQKIADEKVRSMEDYVDSIRAKEITREQGYISKEEREKRLSEAISHRKSGEKRDYTSYYTTHRGTNEAVDETEKRVTNATELLLNQYFAENESPEEDSDDEDISVLDEEERIEKQQYKEAKEASIRANSKTKPFIIRDDEYNDYPHHEKTTLYYFTEDGIIVTEDNEVINDPESLIGNAIEESGFDRNMEDSLYVRNFRRSTDYEIAKVYDAFSEQ